MDSTGAILGAIEQARSDRPRIVIGISGFAAQRGQDRDRQLGRKHEALWNEVWVPNDRDFDQGFSPREFADIIYLATF